MSCAKSSGGAGAGAGNPSSALKLGSLSLTCSLNGELGKGSRISGDWTEKSTGESGATTVGSGATTGGSKAITKGICASSEKRSKIEEEDREARK